MRTRASSGHEVPAREPIRLEPGDEVTVRERDTQWPAFVFVTGSSGKGWVPSRHLSANAGTGVVITPYDTTELELAASEKAPSSTATTRAAGGGAASQIARRGGAGSQPQLSNEGTPRHRFVPSDRLGGHRRQER